MLRRVGVGLLYGAGGYVAGAIAGVVLVNALSSNGFDRQMEAVMTGAFATGPLAAVVAFIVGMVRGGPKART